MGEAEGKDDDISVEAKAKALRNWLDMQKIYGGSVITTLLADLDRERAARERADRENAALIALWPEDRPTLRGEDCPYEHLLVWNTGKTYTTPRRYGSKPHPSKAEAVRHLLATYGASSLAAARPGSGEGE